MDMVTCLQCLHPTITRTTLRQFHRIALAMVVMTGRVTMLGLSRWAGSGGSYRTVQRFFATVIPWATLFWVFFRQHVYRPGEVYLVAGDEVVATKAGKHTHGLDRFFASLYGKPVPGLAFFTLSLVRVQQRRSFPLCVEQVVRTLEFAGLAKYGFGVAKMFSGFYQNPKQSVVNEDREDVRMWRVAAVLYCRQQLGRALDLMGVAVPARM